jgi:tetratricopeptide (TPR) repeat protein
MAGFQGQPSLRNLVRQMSPKQRQGARASLAVLEQKAKSAEALAVVAQGYLLLDEGGSEAGLSAVRIAGRLQELAPGKSAGYTLAASGCHQMGNYPAATEWAKKAMKLNPHDDAAIAVFMLSAGRTARGEADSGGGSTPPPPASEWLVPEEAASPQAQESMRKAVKAREAGDFEGTMRFSQAAMRADPSSRGVQEFYLVAAEDHARHVDATEYLRLAKKALDAGHRTEAVDWALKAARRSGDPKALESLASFERKVAELPPEMAMAATANKMGGLAGSPNRQTTQSSVGLFLKWAAGIDGAGWTWDADSPLTDELKTHPEINAQREHIRAGLSKACGGDKIALEKDFACRLAKLPFARHMKTYLTDPFNIVAGGSAGRPAIGSVLGSFRGTWEVIRHDCCRGTAEVAFHVSDKLRVSSLTRLPWIGYKSTHTAWSCIKAGGNCSIGSLFGDDPLGKDGPLGTRRIDFRWSESIQFEGGAKQCR